MIVETFLLLCVAKLGALVALGKYVLPKKMQKNKSGKSEKHSPKTP